MRRLLVTAALLAGCGGDPLLPPDVVARIEGRQIAYADFEAYLRENSVESGLAVESAAASRLFDQFLGEELLQRLARDRGLAAEGSSSAAALEALLAAEGSEAVSDAEVEEAYRSRAETYRRPERVRLRQILVADREAAAAALAELEAGAPFEEVAASRSQGPAASRAGDQGVLTREDLPPAFVDLIFGLETGAHSQVVPADYGYHIFQVTRRWPAESVPLEQAAPEIRERLAGERLRETRARLVEEARRRYNLRVDEKNLPFHYQGMFRDDS
ncbi:MAG: peptidylprolyl isomerase [Thermoanaerobaculia bacterium]|nr:peptidylprolyl isomerase [Thermoanaerobaculia bacterium]